MESAPTVALVNAFPVSFDKTSIYLYNTLMEDHPSEEERIAMMGAAIDAVRKVQERIRREQEHSDAPQRQTGLPNESLAQPDETVRMPLPDPMAQAAALCRRYPDMYKGILRAATRNLEKDHATRHKIYELLHCEPEQ